MHTGPLSEQQLREGLPMRRVGGRVIVLDSVDSTNRFLLDQPPEVSVDGWVVVAEHQSGGRGRRGRRWDCPTGAGLLCTVGFEDDTTTDANLLSLVVPIALCEAIRGATRVNAEIKWPNDVVVARRKLGGVLIEAVTCQGRRTRYAIGFGVNCLQHAGHFSTDLRGSATSLDLESPEAIDRHAVLQAILETLDAWLSRTETWNIAMVCTKWRQCAVGLGGRVRLEHAGETFDGHVIDIDPTSAILVQLDEGGRRLFQAANTSILDLSF